LGAGGLEALWRALKAGERVLGSGGTSGVCDGAKESKEQVGKTSGEEVNTSLTHRWRVFGR
jgi:hypothetical protein